MERDQIIATVKGIGLDFAGRSLGWALTLAGLWAVVAVIVGSVAMAEWIDGAVR